jgi:hypothetical protein
MVGGLTVNRSAGSWLAFLPLVPSVAYSAWRFIQTQGSTSLFKPDPAQQFDDTTIFNEMPLRKRELFVKLTVRNGCSPQP